MNNNENELVTQGMFRRGMEELETRFDSKIDALALATQQEFVAVREEIKEIKETMVTKQDLFRVETRILAAIGDLAVIVKGHAVRILALEKIVKP